MYQYPSKTIKGSGYISRLCSNRTYTCGELKNLALVKDQQGARNTGFRVLTWLSLLAWFRQMPSRKLICNGGKLIIVLLLVICNQQVIFTQTTIELTEAPSSNIANFGAGIVIPEITIYEGKEAGQEGLFTKGWNKIQLTAPTGFKISTIETITISGSDINADLDNPTIESPRLSVIRKFKIKNTESLDEIYLKNIVLSPDKEYDPEKQYSGQLKVAVFLRGNETAIETVKFPEDGNYYMIKPKLTFNGIESSYCMGEQFNATMDVGTMSGDEATGYFSLEDKFTVHVRSNTNSNDITPEDNTLGDLNGKELNIDQLLSGYKAIDIEFTFKSEWKLKRTLSIEPSSSANISVYDKPVIEFKKGKEVSVTIFEGNVALSNFVEDAEKCTFAIDGNNMQHLNKNNGKYYFNAGKAGVGTYEITVKRKNEDNPCISEEKLKIIVIPDLITAKNTYCYGIDTDETIKLAKKAFDNIVLDGEQDFVSFDILKIIGNGEILDTFTDKTLTNEGFYEFKINPTEYLNSVFGEKAKANVNILMSVIAKHHIIDNERIYYDNIPNSKVSDYDDCSPTSDNRNRCYRMELKETIRFIKVASKVSQIVLPANDGYIVGFDSAYCQGDKAIRLEANYFIEKIEGEYVSTNTPTNGGIEYYLKPNLAEKGKNTPTTVTLSYLDGNNCPGDTTYKCTIHAKPQVEFTTDTVCHGKSINFTQHSPDSVWVNITNQNWNFGDGDIISNFFINTTIIPQDIHGGNTSGTFKSPNHKYDSSGIKTVKLEVMSDAGCKNDTSKEITIGQYPETGFTVSGLLQNKPMKLSDSTRFKKFDPVKQYKYTITKPSGEEVLVHLDNEGEGDYSYTPDEYGVYKLRLDATTKNGCSSYKETQLPVYQVIEVNNETPFFDRFADSNKKYGWITSSDYLADTDSGWKYIPLPGSFNDSKEHTSGYIWRTGDPKDSIDNEISWLESPCFHLQELSFPMVSLDIFQSMDAGREGVAIFYAIGQDTSWKRLGGDNTGGANWYNKAGIFSNPGSSFAENEGFKGWSKDNSAWVRARHALDMVKAERKDANTCVRFRIAYNGNSNHDEKYKGFAIDNFLIGKRKRIVLLEEFINSALEADFPNEQPRTKYNELNTLLDLHPDEVVDIRYHMLNWHRHDPLCGIAPMDVNARSISYGSIDHGPMWVMDGVVANQDFYGNLIDIDYQTAFQQRSLIDPTWDINDVQLENTGGSLKISATISKLSGYSDEKWGKHGVKVRCAIVKKEHVKDGKTYRNVLVDLLPNGTGNWIENIWHEDVAVGEKIQVEGLWTPSANICDSDAKFRVILFVQGQLNYHEVDAVWFKDLDSGETPSSLHGQQQDKSTISLWPNPAKDNLYLHNATGQCRKASWEICKLNGQVIQFGKFEGEKPTQTINIEMLSEGMYILRVQHLDGTQTNERFVKTE